jgi:starch synthase (maltosyl-transferring)
VPGQHGTLRDCADQLDYIAALGFDVVYLPPIHPIGLTHRKGKNNTPEAEPDDVGSPWAIGGTDGGHTAIHPDLGSFDDFDHLVARARALGMEVALDLAFQCSPDHPWVKEHPSWFRWRPDGTVQFAENPPKRYEDIYPLDFESADWAELWQGLLEVAQFWMERGISIFRVDNPHTKSFRMWEWLIGELRAENPDVILLAEAFTRPKVMSQLAKSGFTQSYTYFTWRTSAWEIEQYMVELTSGDTRAFFRPNFWPTTPDILPEHLQNGNRAIFMARIVLAATLTANYGIYGPALELMERVPRPGAEEYIDNEKYQLRHWDRDRPDSLAPFVGRLNRIRHDNVALQHDSTLRFHYCDNEQLLCYSKTPPSDPDRHADTAGPILVVVNLDPHNPQRGFVHLDLEVLDLADDSTFQVHDLLSDDRYTWTGAANYVELNPWVSPAHVFRVRTHARSEHDFEYFA